MRFPVDPAITRFLIVIASRSTKGTCQTPFRGTIVHQPVTSGWSFLIVRGKGFKGSEFTASRKYVRFKLLELHVPSSTVCCVVFSGKLRCCQIIQAPTRSVVVYDN